MSERIQFTPDISRRHLLQVLGLTGAAAALGPRAMASVTPQHASRVVTKAARTKPAGSDLGAVDHIVYLMLENRSYDHYFGAYPKGRGFDDHPRGSLGAFAQPYPGHPELFPANRLLPYHLGGVDGTDCTSSLDHGWGAQHLSWNNGRMNAFAKTHGSQSGASGAMTMGYYLREDIPYYWALADKFTLLDGYHASILGPTHPNRSMANTGTIDPAGKQGGPITATNGSPDFLWSCTWPTMQEVLEDANISWKVYHPSFADAGPLAAELAVFPTWNPALYNPTINPEVMFAADHVLPYFKAFKDPASSLYQKAFNPTFPGEFAKDVKNNTLPKVSWLMAPLGFDDHPSASPTRGQWFVSLVLDALMSNPEVWSRTVFMIMYDENDGFFDHVPPPVAPKGTPGEYLTAYENQLYGAGDEAKSYGGGNLGMGVRLPALMISPFSRGGHVISDVFDHTSQLRLIEERFGVKCPNISQWRRDTAGDLTSTLFNSPTDVRAPHLPTTTKPVFTTSGNCEEVGEESEFGGATINPPTEQRMPTQKGTTVSAREYFRK